ncbi:c-type cytochrome [Flagellimonas allohymeniacidonis]|uniref:C-type cytochrome n=2 Tax=Flagellimonas allohymeniacidonis TaxID=2517819 RepID=A0A4Q8QKG4_9FLAO|nr:c-type cytochrome [Allomuricauda hymeniacidonis]
MQYGLQKLKGIVALFFSAICTLSLIIVYFGLQGGHGPNAGLPSDPYWIYTLDYTPNNSNLDVRDSLVAFGFSIFKETPQHIGPLANEEGLRLSGNMLSCSNCHLDQGTKPYSAPLIGVVQRFPQYRGREHRMGTIEDRINGCMERSMNGKMMSPNGKEMRSLVAYLTWLGRYAPKDGQVAGKGFMEFTIPDRPVNTLKGGEIYGMQCAKCHRPDGQGLKSGNTYIYPPLWGPHSYNNGAGMARVLTAARFIKGNMPFGTTYENPLLSDDEAYDVAGYINQQNRPTKLDLEKDFPDLKRKPVSSPYPPYADNFPIEQHQMGPYAPMMEYYLKTYNIKKTK